MTSSCSTTSGSAWSCNATSFSAARTASGVSRMTSTLSRSSKMMSRVLITLRRVLRKHDADSLFRAAAVVFFEQCLGFVDQRLMSPVGRHLIQLLFGASVQRLDAEHSPINCFGLLQIIVLARRFGFRQKLI